MDSALARIRSIEKLKPQAESEEENETIGAIVKGNKVSPGTSLSGEAKEAAEVSYFERVRDRVSEHWSLPPWLARQELSAQMLIQIDKQGRITRQKLVKSSGNPRFDEAITRALNTAQPLPTPPPALPAYVAPNGILVALFASAGLQSFEESENKLKALFRAEGFPGAALEDPTSGRSVRCPRRARRRRCPRS